MATAVVAGRRDRSRPTNRVLLPQWGAAGATLMLCSLGSLIHGMPRWGAPARLASSAVLPVGRVMAALYGLVRQGRLPREVLAQAQARYAIKDEGASWSR